MPGAPSCRTLAALIAITILLAGQGRALARPQASTEPPPIASSLRALDTLLQNMAPPDVEAVRAHQRATAALSQLLRLSASWPAQSPADYRASLMRTVEALVDARGRRDEDTRGLLQALADDLEAKLEHCRRSGGKLGGSVLVRVRTVQANGEARRWQVLYMPRILEFSPKPVPDVFPQLSSPTDELLVPGRYVMWARNPATGRVGERTVVKVGEGRTELVLDLPVPGEPAP